MEKNMEHAMQTREYIRVMLRLYATCLIRCSHFSRMKPDALSSNLGFRA